MSWELEIEFKNLLTAVEFNRLCQAFRLGKDSFFRQVNVYYDTPDFQLKQKRCALRVRKTSDDAILQLKRPHRKGLLETHQRIVLDHGDWRKLNEGPVIKVLSEMGINAGRLVCLGELETNRAEIPYGEGLIALDASTYLDVTDYELEYEVQDQNAGRKAFFQLLNRFAIPRRPAAPKIARFYARAAKAQNHVEGGST